MISGYLCAKRWWATPAHKQRFVNAVRGLVGLDPIPCLEGKPRMRADTGPIEGAVGSNPWCLSLIWVARRGPEAVVRYYCPLETGQEHGYMVMEGTPATMGHGPKYPNQQLRSVSLETYFPGRLDAFAAFGRIQNSVAETLPSLFVPNVQPGEAFALRPFQLRNATQSRSLAVAVNQVAFIAYEYPGYATFRVEALEAIEPALQMIGTKQLSRVVYRYENEVGIAREPDGSLPLKRIFPKLTPTILTEGNCRSLDASFEHDWGADAHRGTRGFHARVEQAGPMEALRVSVHASVSDCNTENLAVAADKAHELAFDLFESLISEEFRSFISSETEPHESSSS